MSDEQAAAVPLLEQLRRVPPEAHEWRQDGLSWHNIPYGRLCKEAADEIEQWKNAARIMAAIYGANVHFDGGSWFRDNIEISLDEELPPEHIEELLQIALKATHSSVNEALQTKDCDHEPMPAWSGGTECSKCGEDTTGTEKGNG